MNNLSWMIYLANAFDTSVKVLVTSIVFIGIGLVISTVVTSATEERFIPPKKRYILSLILLGFFTSLIPDRDTMYMIVASESAGVIVESQEAKETLSLVKAVIDKQLRSILEESK